MKKVMSFLLVIFCTQVFADGEHKPHPGLVTEPGITQNSTLVLATPPNQTEDYKFRMNIAIVNDSYNDPIIFPHREGAAHHHMYFGNENVDEHSVNNPVATHNKTLNHSPLPIEGMSGQGVNSSAYWAPVLYGHGPDGQVGTAAAQLDDVPIAFSANQVYYEKSGIISATQFDQYWEDNLQPLPEGLQIITDPGTFLFRCANISPSLSNFVPVNGASGISPFEGDGGHFPACDTTQYNAIWMYMRFPNCWDGVNLTDADFDNDPLTTSPTTKHDHMQFQVQATGECPAGTVLLPRVAYNLNWPIQAVTDDTSKYYLSSDVSMVDGFTILCAPGDHGCTNHADWMNGWEPSVMDKMVSNVDGCLGSLAAKCGNGQVTATEALLDTPSGLFNPQLTTLSFNYQWKYNKPILLDPPDKLWNMGFNASVPVSITVDEISGVCYDQAGGSSTNTYTVAEFTSSLVNPAGFPSVGTYTYDYEKLGELNGGGYVDTNAPWPCTGFCFTATADDGNGTISDSCSQDAKEPNETDIIN